MDIVKDIQPMTTFRNNSAAMLNGKAAAVVQDAEAYQRLLDLAAEADAAEGIRQGIEDLERGHVRVAGRAVARGNRAARDQSEARARFGPQRGIA